MKNVHYFVITPVRNEEEHLKFTIDSVASQTSRPRQWIIVDDGSSDRTGKIADEAASLHPWIRVVHREDRGFRKAGGGVIEAFYDGYRCIKPNEWEYVVKLDGDLSFDPDYFERSFQQFRAHPKLGIGGGAICTIMNGAPVEESGGDPSFHVRGATKIYRRACWEAIGGLVCAPGWDGIDEFKANMLGWTTYTFRELKLVHHRRTGGAEGTWKDSVKNGRADYTAGYHPLFMACKCLKRSLRRPYALRGLGFLVGYLSGYVRRLPQVNDKELIRYLRREQMRKLLFQPSLWDRKTL